MLWKHNNSRNLRKIESGNIKDLAKANCACSEKGEKHHFSLNEGSDPLKGDTFTAPQIYTHRGSKG